MRLWPHPILWNFSVVPYYNGSSWSTFCFIEVGGSLPSFSFEYYEEEYWFSIPATTSLVSLHYDAMHKGYYEAVYRAVNAQYGVDVTFNIRIGVGHLFVATPQIQSQYRYNDQGYRTEKEITEIASNTIQTITYTLSGDKVLDESDGTYQIVYAYDYDGTIGGRNGQSRYPFYNKQSYHKN